MTKARVLSAAEGPGLEYYIKKFTSVDPHKFAVIKVSGECIQKDLDALVTDLAAIQSYGLQPVVLFGWGKILDQKMKEAGMPIVKIDDLRYTDETVLAKIEETVKEIMSEFSALARKHNLKYADLTSPIFTVKPLDQKFGYVGDAVGVDTKGIEKACAEGKIPLIAPLGIYGSQVYNINGDTASKQLVSELLPLKYIGVTGTGGVLDRNGDTIKRVSIIDDFAALTQEPNPIVSKGMALKIREAEDLFKMLKEKGAKNGYCVELTSPYTLLNELFTYRGAGTKITPGYALHVHPWPNGVNLTAANDLIQRVSGKVLVPNYWQTEPIHAVIDEVDDCAGIAVLEKHNGWMYMDKFYVDFESQATGLGSKIFSAAWDSTQQEAPVKGLFWRANIDNSKVEWYTKKMSEFAKKGVKIGMESEGEWFVCWMGGERSQIGEIVEYAANKPKTLIKQ